MFPFHCNKCYRLKELEELITLDLYMSQCGHILCRNCMQTSCAICTQPFKPSPITTNIRNTSMGAFFEDPLQRFRHFQKIVKFQLKQQANILNYFVNVMPTEWIGMRAQRRGFDKLDLRLTAVQEKEQARIIKLKEYLNYLERHPETKPKQHRLPSKSSRKTRDSGVPSNSDGSLGATSTCPDTPTISSICSVGVMPSTKFNRGLIMDQYRLRNFNNIFLPFSHD